MVSRHLLSLLACAAALAAAPVSAQTGGQTIYADSLQNGWQDWSWATVNFGAASPVHSGQKTLAVTEGAWTAVYLHHDPFDSSPYQAITFWIHGGPSGGQHLQLQAQLSGQAQTAYALPVPAANAWTQITVPLSKLGVAGKPNLDGFWLQDTSGAAEPTFYLDDIALTGGGTPPPPVAIRIDANAGRHPISPLIYGLAFASSSALADLNAPLNRQGGNSATRYNWQINATNHAADWFFESIGESSATAGEWGDTFFANSKSGGAKPMLTVPMIGWVAKLGPNRGKTASFSVAKYGPQQSTDQWMPDAGNGVKTDGKTQITGNDPNDADVPSDVAFQTGWIKHLIAKWGKAPQGGVSYYLMDNEPSIWQSTHRDVHPVGPKMDEILQDILAYGGAVKDNDPAALVIGPEEWGWSGYLYSGYDQQYASQHNWSSYPDRAAHGNMDYIPWLLQQIAQHDKTAGRRTLDYVSVHIYPQGGEGGNDTSSGTVLLRNRSTRELWDPNYVSQSWINDKVQLIPRLKQWAADYPGTKTAITEYNWGAEGDISGATAQADILGIFGREGLDLATRWTTPDAATPTYQAIKLYRNYDGKKSGFGETSVSDTVPNPDVVASFAALRASDGAMTVIVINKTLSGTTPVTISLANFAPGAPAQTWQLTKANAITHLADTPISGGALKPTLPAQSVTLFVIPKAR